MADALIRCNWSYGASLAARRISVLEGLTSRRTALGSRGCREPS